MITRARIIHVNDEYHEYHTPSVRPSLLSPVAVAPRPRRVPKPFAPVSPPYSIARSPIAAMHVHVTRTNMHTLRTMHNTYYDSYTNTAKSYPPNTHGRRRRRAAHAHAR